MVCIYEREILGLLSIIKKPIPIKRLNMKNILVTGGMVYVSSKKELKKLQKKIGGVINPPKWVCDPFKGGWKIIPV